MPTQTYQPRAIRFLDIWEVGDLRLKAYGIAHSGEPPSPALVEAALGVVVQWLGAHPTRQLDHAVGFVGIHDGRTENQVFLDRWINHNELLHTYWVSAKDRPADLRAPADAVDHNSVCVWDLALQCFERRAWVERVMKAGGAPGAIEAYLAQRMSEDV